MNINLDLKPGKYIVAVSGGVDSMVLLDVLCKQKDIELIIAHFDHGIRDDSSKDRELVQKIASKYGVSFEYAQGKLRPDTSEAEARKARYDFLYSVKDTHNARAIITAHHQDDALETAFINLLRGTGRKGLTSLSSGGTLLRPLLSYRKIDLIEYASKNDLEWNEDSTNASADYLRNYLRLKIIPKVTSHQREKFIKNIDSMKKTNREIDNEIAILLQNKSTLDKKMFSSLPHALACEVMTEWLRQNDIREFDRKTIERLVIASKTFKNAQKTDINKQKYLLVDENTLVITV